MQSHVARRGLERVVANKGERVIVFAVIGHDVDGRIMPAADALDFLGGNLGSSLLRLYRKTVLFCRNHPLIHARRLRRREFGFTAQTIEYGIVLANDHPQSIAFDLKIIFGADLLRTGQIKA